MQLDYLDFDFSDEEGGRGSFDAMASVLPGRLPALTAEIAGVLRWARASFGPAGALEDEGEWDYELQAVAEPDTPLDVSCDEGNGEVRVESRFTYSGRVTFTFTLSGSPGFCDAFREKFGAGD